MTKNCQVSKAYCVTKMNISWGHFAKKYHLIQNPQLGHPIASKLSLSVLLEIRNSSISLADLIAKKSISLFHYT